MSTVTAEVNIEGRVDERRARFRDAVGGLATRARSGDLLRMLLLPAAGLVIGGFGLMVLGWWGAAHTHRQIEQIPYLISGGLIGLGLVLLGGLLLATAVWMATLRRMQEQADERGRAHLAELVAALPQAPARTSPPPTAPKPRASRARAAG
jgi:Zn-dependent protease with chaperone function